MSSREQPQPEEWKIRKRDDGVIEASGPVSMIVDDAESGKLFMRNTVRYGGGVTEHKRFLVGELDGVRVYLSGNRVLITKRNLYPK